MSCLTLVDVHKCYEHIGHATILVITYRTRKHYLQYRMIHENWTRHENNIRLVTLSIDPYIRLHYRATLVYELFDSHPSPEVMFHLSIEWSSDASWDIDEE